MTLFFASSMAIFSVGSDCFCFLHISLVVVGCICCCWSLNRSVIVLLIVAGENWLDGESNGLAYPTVHCFCVCFMFSYCPIVSNFMGM